MRWVYQLCEPVEGLLQLAPAHSEEVDELFRKRQTAVRPQAKSSTACQYQAIVVVSVHSIRCVGSAGERYEKTSSPPNNQRLFILN